MLGTSRLARPGRAGWGQRAAAPPAMGSAQRNTHVPSALRQTPQGAAGEHARPHRQQRRATGRRHAVAVNAFLKNIFKNDPSDATRKKYQSIVDLVNSMEPTLSALSDAQLRAKTDEFRRRLASGQTLDGILPEAFAVRAAAVAAAGSGRGGAPGALVRHSCGGRPCQA